MPDPLLIPSRPKLRRTARDRLVRRQRIMERLREGRSYEEIAEAEGLSRERIRQIVVQALEQRTVEAQREHAQLQGPDARRSVAQASIALPGGRVTSDAPLWVSWVRSRNKANRPLTCAAA